MKLNSIKDLYIEELRDLYDAEHKLFDGLTAMAETAVLPELKKAFADHLEQTRHHAERLEGILRKLDANPLGNPCRTMDGLIAECQDLISEEKTADPGVLDAALIGAAQKIEHFEIAGYGCARTYAELLGEKEAAAILQSSLDEEGETNKLLTRIALRSVNTEAAEATSEETMLASATAEAINALASHSGR